MASRKLEVSMVDFLDRKLKDNGLAIEAMKRRDARQLMRLAALACVGIREEGGNNRGPLVELIQETIGGADREAWCMSFVQTMLEYAEERTSVYSEVFVSESCDQVWTGTDKKWRVKSVPLPGAIVIWGRYNKKGQYLGGHTGILDAWAGETFFAVEGNTSGGVTSDDRVVRDGGGVYYTKRRTGGQGDMKVRGFLIPFPKD